MGWGGVELAPASQEAGLARRIKLNLNVPSVLLTTGGLEAGLTYTTDP